MPRNVAAFAFALIASSAAFATFAMDAEAHILLSFPAPRTTELKDGPCGLGASDKRATKACKGVAGETNCVSTFKPGAKLTVRWKETIDHPGHFRVSFDDNGSDGFVDPKSFTDLKTSPTVLVDDIKDKSGDGATYSQEITLPTAECTNCTLQVIQVMTDKAPYGDGDDLYYQCADIVLSSGAEEIPEPAPEEEGTSSGSTSSSGSSGVTTQPANGCASGGSSKTGLAAAGLLAMVGVASALRRRKSK